MWEPLAIVLTLAGAILVISALTSVRTHFSLLLTGSKQEGVIESRQGLVRLKLYAAKQGSLTEASLDIRFARFAVFRIDYPVVRLGRRGKRPVVRVHREVEVGGTGSASPVAKADKEYGPESLLRAVEEVRLIFRSVAPQLRQLASKVSLSDMMLEVDESTGSPDSTAWVYGLLWGVLGSARAGLSRAAKLAAPPILRVRPIYGAAHFRLEASGGSTVRALHVMVFVLRSLRALWALARRHVRMARQLSRLQALLPTDTKARAS